MNRIGSVQHVNGADFFVCFLSTARIQLEFQQENRCKRRKRSSGLQPKNAQRRSRRAGQPSDREDRHKRYLCNHQQLEDMGSSALIGLPDGPEQNHMTQNRCQGG